MNGSDAGNLKGEAVFLTLPSAPSIACDADMVGVSYLEPCG